MIDEAIGKILGMVMAYAASALGMFVAYANYRKRIVKADRVMTSAAWAVVLASLLAVGGGALLVVRLAQPSEALAAAEAPAAEAPPAVTEVETGAPVDTGEPAEPRAVGWVGVVVPASVFLLATIVTAALHRHFSRVEAHG